MAMYLLAIVIGACMVLVVPINAALGRHIGQVEAGVVNFTVGLACVLAVSAAAGRGDWAAIAGARPWQLMGGLLGAAIVVLSVVAIGSLGAARLFTVVVLTQLAVSVIIDHFGLLGVETRPANGWVFAGLVLAAIGTLLVQLFRPGP
ncbi:MAG: DMT family transporter [Firmicutes bacterium]|nr:DMT family transporter [Bacillota bacterium]